MTERKLAEDALRKSEEYYRALIENATDAIVIIDEGGILKYSNLTLEGVLGYEPRELMGKLCLDYLHPEDIPRAARVIAEAVRDPDYSLTVEVRIRRADGAYTYFEGIGSSYLDNPCVEGIVIALRDISERKKVEEELGKHRENLEELVEERTHELNDINRRLMEEIEERMQVEDALRAANQELEAFAYTLSHDLRSPLAVASGFARVALSAVGEDRKKPQRDCLENILQAVEQTDAFINSLYDYARAGLAGGEAVRVEPDAVLSEVITYLEEEVKDNGTVLKIDEGLPEVYVDPLKLRQVLSNLAENAVRYMGGEPEPRVEIGGTRKGDTVTMYVRDNGMGIPVEKQGIIFEPFKCLQEGDSSGLGIGLSTVKRAVEAWGGRVWVESRPGEGSTFFFTAPSA
jgi:PAS domain S-box-containing protein